MKRLISFLLMVMCFAVMSQQVFAADKKMTEYKVGDVSIISIQDTSMFMDSKLLIGDKNEINKYVPTGKCDASINVFLLKSGKELVLFDSGLGGFGNGETVSILNNAGITPDKITKVIFTHLHGDHVGGVMTDGKKVFPNADLYVPEAELAFWSDKANAQKAPTAQAFAFDMIGNFKKIYGDKIKTFKEGAEIIKGVESTPAYGHTAGHTMYKVSSKGDEMLLWGDIMHCLAAQIANPGISISFDSNPSAAAKTRTQVLSENAGKRRIAGAHLPYPGIIEIKKSGDKYEYKLIEGK